MLWFCPMELLRTSFFALLRTAYREMPFHLCPSPPAGKLPKGDDHVCHVNHSVLLHCAFHLVLHAFAHLFMYSSTQPLNPRSLKIFEDCTFFLSLLLTQPLDNTNRAILGQQNQNMGTERTVPSLILNPNFLQYRHLKYINS